MAGRPKIKCYEYSKDGKFVREYESMKDVRTRYFANDVTNRPLFKKQNDYFVSPNDTYIANYRIGRHRLLKEERIRNCNFCNYNKHVHDKSFKVYNLLGEPIAEFKNAYIASKMLDISPKTIWARLNYATSKHKTKPNSDNLEFKYI